MTRRKFLSLLAFLALVFVISGVSSLITGLEVEVDGWYAGLVKPAHNPPVWVFGPVWTALYIMIAIAGWRVWMLLPADARFSQRFFSPVMRPYWVQLMLNFMWSPVFFGLQLPAAAAVVITFMLAAILWNLTVFNQLDKKAAYLLVPYALWVSYALSLNHAIVQLN